ncbi:hypothetical protein [uncultured Brachyspira sp.]|uniref:hypothetical protein n=1 Tax=uncultured Brachyspira sp. TaxID=221953 RepID=UPI00261E59F6|nr:hypothetical protein [uncultured Brachyspira sp.]
MKDYSQAFINTNGEEFPNTKAVDANSPGATNGTEIIADLLNDNWGFSQALLKTASISPNGEDESADNSQKLEAIMKLINSHIELNDDTGYQLKRYQRHLVIDINENVHNINLTAENNINYISNILIINNTDHNVYIQYGTDFFILFEKSSTEFIYIDSKFKLIRGEGMGKQEIIDLLHPIGSTYIQFAEDNGTFDASKSPEKLFGGTWQLKYNTESVFFRTEGSLSEEGRSNGIQGDAVRNIYGTFPFMSWSSDGQPYQSGFFKISVVNSEGPVTTYTNTLPYPKWVNSRAEIIFNNSGIPISNNEIRSKNRKIRVYKRIA